MHHKTVRGSDTLSHQEEEVGLQYLDGLWKRLDWQVEPDADFEWKDVLPVGFITQSKKQQHKNTFFPQSNQINFAKWNDT